MRLSSSPARWVALAVVAGVLVAAALSVGPLGAVGAQSSGGIGITDIQADAPGEESENLRNETVTITNGLDTSVDLMGYTLDYGFNEQTFLFEESLVLESGDSVTVQTGGEKGEVTSTNTSSGTMFTIQAGFDSPVLNNDGETVTLRNVDGNVEDQVSYGDASTGGTTTVATEAPETANRTGPQTPVGSPNENVTPGTADPVQEQNETTEDDTDTTTEKDTTTSEDGGATTMEAPSDGGADSDDGADGKAKDTDAPSDGADGKAKQDSEDGGSDGKAKQDGEDRAADDGDGKAKQPSDGADGGNGKAKLS
ncbi:hypothetical protein BRC90_10765 [Halobacteriales archaeon QS_4_69_34]|nr:MAG: hypothetical protein BRC90_10765 [Halobacteriales archaeon QS_4_69_34]